MIVGLGAASNAPGGTTWGMCHALPTWVAVGIAACRDVFSSDAALAYQYGMYGGSAAPVGAPGPAAPGSTAQDNIDAYIKAQQDAIKQAEAGGYSTTPYLPGLTASDLNQDVENIANFDYKKWLIYGGLALVVVLVLVPKR